jgi:hypothetical protein
MIRHLAVVALAFLLPAGSAPAPVALAAPSEAPAYAADGSMKLPENYREWIFLTSSLDMNYNDPAPVAGHSLFQNVFVNPTSYHAFLTTGAWPDKTTFILELRGADAHVNIDKRGQSQTTDLRAIEIHVKDEAKLPEKWGFYNFGKETTGKLIARPATCYSCHEGHAAVDTTFVQFYPTLFNIAKEKKTLSPEYLEDTSFLAAPAAGK